MTSLNKTDVFLLKWLNKQKDIVYQNDIPKLTGIDAKTVSKSLYKLEKLGLIIREQTDHNKRKTYIVKIDFEKAAKQLEEIGETLFEPRDLFEQIADIPCLSCQNINKCYEGGFYDPVYCPLIFDYLFGASMREKYPMSKITAKK